MSDSSMSSDSDFEEQVNKSSDSDEAPKGKAKTKKTKASKALHSGSESEPLSEDDDDDDEKPSAARKRTKPTPVRSTKRTKRTRSDSNSDDEMFRKLEADGIEMTAEEREKYLEMSEKMREEFIYQKTIDMENKKHREEIQTKIRLRKPGKNVKVVPKPTSDSEDEDRSPSPKGRASPTKDSDSDYDAEFQRPSEIDKKRKQKSALSDLLSKRREKEKKEAKKAAQVSETKDGDESDSSASSSSSSSTSQSSTVSSVSSRARSATPEQEEVPKKQVETKAELELARISRFRLAKFVHAPFFKKTLIGCYVRVGGLPPSPSGNAISIGYVLDVVETAKTYNVENQRTNKGLKLRFGARDERIIRLEFISNQQFSEKDFTEWMSVMKNTGATLPTVDQLEKKAKEIKEASNHSYTDAEVDAMLVERKRFEQKTGNFAARKNQLLTEKAKCEAMGDREGAARADRLLQENEERAQRLDRERQGAIVGVTWLNKRNRNHMKETFLGDTPIADMKKDDDPFTRKSGRMKVVSGKATTNNSDAGTAPKPPASATPAPAPTNGTPAKASAPPSSTPSIVSPTTSMRQSDLFKMHAVTNIDYGDLDIALGSRPNPPKVVVETPPSNEPKARGKLSLEEYKRRRQLKTE